MSYPSLIGIFNVAEDEAQENKFRIIDFVPIDMLDLNCS